MKVVEAWRQTLFTAVREMEKGHTEMAVNLFQNARAMNPGDPGLHFDCGLGFKELGLFELASHCFSESLRLKPDQPEVLFEQGIAAHGLGRLSQAVELTVMAIELRPDYPDAHRNLYYLLAAGEPGLDARVYRRLFSDSRVAALGPRRIRLETSSICNLRCRHCPTGSNYGGVSRQVMEMAVFERALSQIKELPIVSDCIFYLGGEPLINQDLALMCRRIKEETGVVYSHFTTNGMLISEQVCRELAGAALDRIVVSIDGRSAAENDLVRRGADYSALVGRVRMLKEHLPETDISISNVQIKRPGDPEIPTVPEFLERDFPGFEIATLYAMKWPGFEPAGSDLGEVGCTRNRPPGFCRMPLTEMAVRANGDLVMCCFDLLSQQVLGNIEDDRLLDIWRGAFHRKLREDIICGRSEQLPAVCRSCERYTGELLEIM